MTPLSILVYNKYAVECEITPRLVELVQERKRYHAEIEDEDGNIDFDNHCYELSGDILYELADMAGVHPTDVSELIQEVCWWVEDRIEEEIAAAE